MRFIYSTLICFSLLNSLQAQDNRVWMVGPMIHYNIGGEKSRFSYALELSYWDYDGFPYSFDAGLEFQKQRVRLYTEAQTGIGVAGLSLGPVLEFQTDNSRIKAGIQGSVWGNYFLGFDLRFRKIDDTYFCPGTYFKIPIVPGENNNSNSSHHDFDWD